ncbi:hypothetical protein ACFQMF_15265 [Halorubrum rutilum]|uniref:Uncharacterized protein n=1 Tax=Halorubrum rutilum TaxID=1364933 RepID=A0ABD6ANU4_9EURY|nr:hypothetical protein [Halorubrum rutilum]
MALNFNPSEDKYVVGGLLAAVIMLVAMYFGGQVGQIVFSGSAVAFIGLYVLLGVQSSEQRHDTKVFKLMVAGLWLILGVAFALLWHFHFQNPAYTDPTYWLGFPRATAVVVYVLWMPPALYLMFAYPYLFSKYIWDKDQVAEFRTMGSDEEGNK